MFTWIPIHREAARRILDHRANQAELLRILREMQEQDLKVISLEDKDANGQSLPLGEIDPFTFLASFNRGVTEQNRRKNWSFLKARWGLVSNVPDDFNGIPLLHNLRSWLIPWAKDRHPDHVDHLWQLAFMAMEGSIEQVDPAVFDRCLELPQVALASLTIGMFWIHPEKFLSADSKNIAYGKSQGISIEPRDYASYRRWLSEMGEKLREGFPQISYQAHLFATQEREALSEEDQETGDARVLASFEDSPSPEEGPSRQYWTLSAGTGGELWQEFYDHGIAAIGWDETSDLRQYDTKEAIRQRLAQFWPSDSSKKNDVLACWQFVHEIKAGDLIFAKQGFTQVLGYGVVEGEYSYDATRARYRHIRKVRWLAKGEWELPGDSKMASKTLTDITPYPGFVEIIAATVGMKIEGEPELREINNTPSLTHVSYWWLNANPRIWNFEETPVGEKQTYTSHNDQGNKRQKYRYFQEVKPGDLVIGYVTSPRKEVVAICRITKGLHRTRNGEEIEFEKVEQLAQPIGYEALQAHPELMSAEPLINNQGSLFKLREEEYEILRSLIDDANLPIQQAAEPYDRRKAFQGLFLAESQFDEMLAALKEKKNLVLQGAPGVGKTYIARRLAYALLESNDPVRIEMIQFHQSYSYEDFIQGFRPTPKGHFDLRHGIFHQFCRRAQRDPARPYVFIIDEINRGNLSKIFGELMMLIEADKRGKEHSMPLAYSPDADERFYIPGNLHLLGMMNTADRSLAMVDYALRRRFRFITLRPEFSSAAFQDFLGTAGASAEMIRRIVSRMNALNEVIAADAKNLGPGYQIGHSYFCPSGGATPNEAWYRRVIESEIVPLIQEYWFDNDPKVDEQRTALLA